MSEGIKKCDGYSGRNTCGRPIWRDGLCESCYYQREEDMDCSG